LQHAKTPDICLKKREQIHAQKQRSSTLFLLKIRYPKTPQTLIGKGIHMLLSFLPLFYLNLLLLHSSHKIMYIISIIIIMVQTIASRAHWNAVYQKIDMHNGKIFLK